MASSARGPLARSRFNLPSANFSLQRKLLAAAAAGLLFAAHAQAKSEPYPQIDSAFLHVLPISESAAAPEASAANSIWQRFNPFLGLPDGLITTRAVRGCDWHLLEDGLLATNGGLASQAHDLQNYLDLCEEELSADRPRDLMALVRLASMRYHAQTNPRIRKVKITLGSSDSAIVLTGLLGLKAGTKPRPLIIARCGIFCDATRSLASQIIMHLFDESPFNLLLLGNTTGVDFAKDNRIAMIGGVEDGRELYEIARALRRPENKLSSRISTIHVFGQSLGANGALYAALFDSLNSPSDAHVFASAEVICPVVNLGTTLAEAMPEGSWISRAIYERETLGFMQRGYAYVPALQSVIPSNFDIPGAELVEKLKSAALGMTLAHWQKAPIEFAPFAQPASGDVAAFWKMQDFEAFARQTTVPLLALGSDDDEVVPAQTNSYRLSALDPSIPTRVVRYRYGSHCAMDVASGWPIFTAVLRAFVAKQSPELLAKNGQPGRLRSSISGSALKDGDLGAVALDPGERHLRQNWFAKPHDGALVLRYDILSESGTCDAVGGRDECKRTAEMRVPLRDLQLPHELYDPDDLPSPPDADSANRLQRWANSNLRVVDKDGMFLVDSGADPAWVESMNWR